MPNSENFCFQLQENISLLEKLVAFKNSFQKHSFWVIYLSYKFIFVEIYFF